MIIMIQPKEIELKDRIMRRVYLAYTLRKALSPNAIRLYVVAIVAAELSPLSPFVSLSNVIANMPDFTDVKALWIFHMYAFLNTHLIVQISLIAFAFVLASYALIAYKHFTGSLGGAGTAAIR